MCHISQCHAALCIAITPTHVAIVIDYWNTNAFSLFARHASYHKLSDYCDFCAMKPQLQVSSCPFYYHGLTLIPAWISNYIPRKAWDEITYPFLNFNGCTVEV